MSFGNRKGCFAYPVLALAILFASASLWAQSAPAQQQSNSQTQLSTEQAQHAQILREAERRVHERHEVRIQQIIKDTYSHQYEIYFGGGYLRFHPGPGLQKNSEANWNAGFSDYFHGRLGATVDFRGYYGTAFVGINQYQVFKPSISQYTFMAGPTYRFFEGQHWGWNAYVLAGAGHGNFDTNTGGLPGSFIGVYPNSTTFNVSPGATVVYNLGPALAVRLSSAYLVSHYGGEFQQNLGYNMGIVYRFGRQK